MTTIDLLDHLLKIIDEAVVPALGAWLVWVLRSWVAKQEHK